MCIVISLYEIVCNFNVRIRTLHSAGSKPLNKDRLILLKLKSLVPQSTWQVHYVCDGKRSKYRRVVLHRALFVNCLLLY
jgi:hypothetical protein